MPRYPEYSQKLNRIPGAAFEKYRKHMQAYGPDLVRLHIGDSYLHPVYPVPIDKSFMAAHDDFNRYCDTFGIEPLRRVLSQKLNEDNRFSVNKDNILVTAGATNALSAAVHSIMNADEEILLLTPCWPIFPGIVRSAMARIIEVPLYLLLYDNPDLDIGQHLEGYITPKTVAIYLNSPNNPSGKVLNRKQLKQVADFASVNNLWILSDEAYDGLLYDDLEHISIGALPEMFSRTISVYTFSKIFLFAGLRLGYATGTQEMIMNLNKILVHQLYSPATLTQQMMVKPIKSRHNWQAKIRNHYQDLRDRVHKVLGLSIPKPEAGYFIFLSIKDYLKGRDYDAVIESLLHNGVSVAPGIDFGSDYKHFIRLCFTGEPPERLQQGIDRLRQILF